MMKLLYCTFKSEVKSQHEPMLLRKSRKLIMIKYDCLKLSGKFGRKRKFLFDIHLTILHENFGSYNLRLRKLIKIFFSCYSTFFETGTNNHEENIVIIFLQ